MREKTFQNRLDGFQFHLKNLQDTYGIGFHIEIHSANWFTRLLRWFLRIRSELKLVDMIQLRATALPKGVVTNEQRAVEAK